MTASPSFSMMTPEVTTNIFCQLLSDVFALSATCRPLRHSWLNSVNQVYNQVAPRSISYEGVARRFFFDEDGPASGSPLSTKDIIRMIQNAGVIEDAVIQFEHPQAYGIDIEVQ